MKKICIKSTLPTLHYHYTLCLGNISKDFTINNMKKAGLERSVKFFSFDFNPIDTNDILDIHNYLMKET